MIEEERLQTLFDLDLLDSSPEEEYDELVHLASEICSTPISLITLVDRDRQWFKAAVGTTLRETPRDFSFCAHALATPDLFVVEDARVDARFSDNPLVEGDSGFRFYAGVPLQAAGGMAVGTLCVVDTIPRSLSPSQKKALLILARQVQARFALRAKHKALERVSKELEQSNALFRAFMDHSPALAYIKDPEGRFIFYNSELATRFEIGKTDWLGKSDADLFSAELAREYREHDLQVLRDGACQLVERTVDRQDRAAHWKSYKFPFAQPDGRVMLAGISVEITAELEVRAALEVALREKTDLADGLQASRAALIALMDRSPNHTYLKDADGRYLYYNQRFAEHFGIDLEQWIGKTDDEVRPGAAATATRERDQAAKESVGPIEIIAEAATAFGEMRTFRSVRFPITGSNGEKMLAGLAIDITVERQREKALSDANLQVLKLTSHDSLTGVANCREFERRLEVEFALANRQKRPLSVLLMNIDKFKQLSNQAGSEAAEEALRLVGSLLSRQVRAGDLAARMGGEEFAFLLPGTDADGAKIFAERIRHHVSQLDLEGRPLTLTISIASVDESTLSCENLMAKADQALYAATLSQQHSAITQR